MKLFVNRPSPYGRKVLVVLHEKRLSDRVEVIPADPWQDPAELIVANPVAKVPVLVFEDGTQLTESTTICEYLDLAVATPVLVGADRWEVMRRVGLAQGLIDAAFATVMERRRPPIRVWPDWIARQRRAIDRVLAVVSKRPPDGRFDLGDISLACALAYLDFRLEDVGWRNQLPEFAGWLDQISQRHSMQATTP